jgi:hypothetical protein
MDLGLQTDVIYTDFSKAFDRLDQCQKAGDNGLLF